MTDPMLDGITRWNQYGTMHDVPDGEYVLFSDLPALIAKVREDERGKWTIHQDRLLTVKTDGYEQGQRDERERIRTGVTGLPWEVAISFGPIDCDYSCEEGPCSCSGVMRPEGWTTGPEDVLAVIDDLKG